MNKKNKSYVEVDFLKILKSIKDRLWTVILVAVIGAVCAFGITYMFIDPTYQASTLLYVNNSDFSVGSSNFSISSSTLTAAQELVDTYIVILETRTTLDDVIDYANVDYSYKELKEMISAAPVNSTEIFEIVVTSKSPKEAEVIANAIAKILPTRISEIVDGSSVRIVDYAVTPSSRSGPSYVGNALIGFIVGAMIIILIIVINEVFDVVVRDEEYLSDNFDIPILAAIPDMHSSKSNGYYYYNSYGYYGKGKEKK